MDQMTTCMCDSKEISHQWFSSSLWNILAFVSSSFWFYSPQLLLVWFSITAHGIVSFSATSSSCFQLMMCQRPQLHIGGVIKERSAGSIWHQPAVIYISFRWESNPSDFKFAVDLSKCRNASLNICSDLFRLTWPTTLAGSPAGLHPLSTWEV